MALLPSESGITSASTTNAQQKLNFAAIRNFLAGLLGTDSDDKAAARSALGVVATSGDESIAGVKTFSSSPVVPTPATTDDSGKAASTAFVRDLALGVDQTVQDLTASRSHGTTYTNSTGKPILVSVTIGTSGTTSLTARIDGNTYASISQVTGHTVSLTFVVPNGSTYSTSVTNTPASTVWREVR